MDGHIKKKIQGQFLHRYCMQFKRCGHNPLADGGFGPGRACARARGQEHNISFLVVARVAARRRAERRRRPTSTAPNSALAVILHFGFVNLYLNHTTPHHTQTRHAVTMPQLDGWISCLMCAGFIVPLGSNSVARRPDFLNQNKMSRARQLQSRFSGITWPCSNVLRKQVWVFYSEDEYNSTFWRN